VGNGYNFESKLWGSLEKLSAMEEKQFYYDLPELTNSMFFYQYQVFQARFFTK